MGSTKGLVTWMDHQDSTFNILALHCTPHCTALDLSAAWGLIQYLVDFDWIMNRLCSRLENSSVRKQILEVFQHKYIGPVALVRAFFTRWLTHMRALKGLRKSLAPLIESLKDEVARKVEGYAETAGILHKMTTYKFWAVTYGIIDILEPMAVPNYVACIAPCI